MIPSIITMHTHLGPLEQEILSEIWRQKTATVRSVHHALSREKELAYTTVMTIMKRLTEKGVLHRTKQGKGHLYTSTKSKQSFLQKVIRTTLDSLVDNYGQEAMVAFLKEADSLSHQDRAKLLEKLKP